jgi:hypothetical protein
MKIAIVFGKGLDGCGVEKYAAVFKDFYKDTLDIYNLKEKSFTRSGGHVKEAIDFLPEDMAKTAKILDENYDIVIFNSYPGNSNKPSTIKSFFFDMLMKVNKPITVAMMHEIKKANYERIPMHIAIANQCDQTYNFSTITDYAMAVKNILTHKADRIRRFRMPMTINYKSVPFEQKEKMVLYAGRWTSMKGPRRVLNFLDIPNNQFKGRLIGIERSIGAKGDIIDHPNCVYAGNFNNWQKDIETHTVFGPYPYEVGQELMSKAMFGYSGFTLPREPQNYGDRMEYSQMEIFINGTIPIFDKHYGENNVDSTGKRYIDNDKIALWSEADDLSDVYEQMVEISNNKELYETYVKNGKEFVFREVSSNIVVPEFIKEIQEIGKEANKLSFEQLITKTHGEQGFENFMSMMNALPDNACSFNVKDCNNKEYSYYVKKKREIYEIKNTEALGDEW